MKAWLKGPTGVVPLSTIQPTTIGRECCDIVIPCPAVDSKHAIIEYDEHSDCFVLRDLNTIFGTYINACHVRNSMIRLTPGDVIKIGFGQTAIQYEFEADNLCSCACPYHSVEMMNSSDPLQERRSSSSKTCLKTTLPQLAKVSSATSHLSVCQDGNAYPMLQQTCPVRLSYCATGPKLNFPGSCGQTYKDECIINECVNFGEVLKKDRKISELNDEVHRLRKVEVETRHKDCQVKELNGQVECLQNQLSQAVNNACNRIEVEALQARIADLENHLQLRASEMAEMNEQMFKLKTTSQKQLNDKVMESNSLREELERYRKDKNILSGLLTQVQKDISMKDTTICRLTTDLERRKNDLSDKDVQIASFQSSFCVVAAHKQLESDLEKMQKELNSVADKLKRSEGNLKASEERYTSLSKTVDKAKVELQQEKQQEKDLQKQLDEISAKLLERNKSNDLLTQELTKLTNTLSRLRRRIQRLLSLRCLATTSKDVSLPDDEEDLSDDQIISTIKQIIEDGNNLSVQLTETNKKSEDLETMIKSIRDCGGKLKEELHLSTGSLSQSPAHLLIALRQEQTAAQLFMTQPVLQDFRNIIVSLIQGQLDWLNEMITTLENCGINVRLSDAGLVKHITELHSKSEESRRLCEESKAKLEEANRQFRRDLEGARDRGRKDVEERSREKIERLTQESEMKIRTEKAVFEQKEKENYEEKINQEVVKIAQLEERLCCLQKENAEKSEELIFYRQQEKQHVQEVESYRKVEAELRDEILERNLAKNETRSSIEQSVRKRYEREMRTLREQSAQLSCTLSSIQERLSKANNKIHRQQLEIKSLRGLSNPCATLNVTPCHSTSGEFETRSSFEVSRVNEKLRAEVKKQQAEIKKLALGVDQCRSLKAEKEAVITRLETELLKAKENAEKVQSQSHTSAELSAVGAECRGEQHLVTIARQKEALTELRKRIKSLQKGPTQTPEAEGDDTLHSTELTTDAEERHKGSASKNNIRSTALDAISSAEADEMAAAAAIVAPAPSPVTPTSSPADPIDGQIQRALLSNVQYGPDKDLKENLELSEQTYSCLLRAVSDKLSLGKMADRILSLADETAFADKKEVVRQQRRDICEEITTELSALKDKVTEYENRIENYEQELARLRNADALLEHKSWQIDGLTSDVRSLVDEVACLHESLNKVREELRKEKRISAAARGKKMCAEKDKVRAMGTIVKHTCFHNDSFHKTKERSKSSEKLKRKSYEIMLLKDEMEKCEKNMERAKNLDRLLMTRTDLVDECVVGGCGCCETGI